MNLVSCDNCGVVLDKDKLNFPTNIYRIDGSVNDKLAEWDSDGFRAKVPCPVCENDILGDKVI